MSNENLSFQATIFVYKNSACRLKGKHCFSQNIYAASPDDIPYSLLIRAFRVLFGHSVIIIISCSSLD